MIAAAAAMQAVATILQEFVILTYINFVVYPVFQYFEAHRRLYLTQWTTSCSIQCNCQETSSRQCCRSIRALSVDQP